LAIIEKFEIGEKEKHIISVETNLVSKFITIELDGERLIHNWHPSPFAKKFQFDVGTSESHKVEVTVGAFTPAVVLVDGKALGRSE
jgi:hypothetical protein